MDCDSTPNPELERLQLLIFDDLTKMRNSIDRQVERQTILDRRANRRDFARFALTMIILMGCVAGVLAAVAGLVSWVYEWATP